MQSGNAPRTAHLQSSLRWGSTALLGCGGIYCIYGTILTAFQRPPLHWFIVTLLSTIGLWVATLCLIGARLCWQRQYRGLFPLFAPLGSLLILLALGGLLGHPSLGLVDLTRNPTESLLGFFLGLVRFLTPLVAAVAFYRFCGRMAKLPAQPPPQRSA